MEDEKCKIFRVFFETNNSEITEEKVKEIIKKEFPDSEMYVEEEIVIEPSLNSCHWITDL